MKLSNLDTIEYGRKNRNALALHFIASEDYIACRCCLLNGLIDQGYILAEQAVEKMLKSIILLISPNEDFRNRKKFRQHNLIDLINCIHDQSAIRLQSFEELAKTLSDMYELNRYPDNKLRVIRQSWYMGTEIIDEVDEMFFSLVEQSPMPSEVKFFCGLYIFIFKRTKPDFTTSHWACLNNKAYESRKVHLLKTFEEVKMHLDKLP